MPLYRILPGLLLRIPRGVFAILFPFLKNAGYVFPDGGRNEHGDYIHAIAERRKSKNYHFHLLLWAYQFDNQQLTAALDATCEEFNLPQYTFKLQSIDDTPNKLNSYCVKEIRADINDHFDTDNIIYSNELFDIPVRCP
ncbi:hypothetical protein FACS18945_2440 [Bacteroidia bacterium]|nr:hypothetical protein FACS18945_2440 [Bacteroidia bacterium]